MKDLVQDQRNLKIRQILYGFIIFVFIVLLRLFYLQVEQKARFSDLGERNFLRQEILPSPRGNFLDCNNFVLASNKPIYDLYWQGNGKRKIDLEQKKILQKVDSILDSDFLNNSKFNQVETSEKYARRVLLREDLTFDQLCQISEQCNNSNNLVIVNRFKRFYPHKNLAGHILGYLSRSERFITQGRAGLEKIFQDKLKGETGYIKYVTNSTGKKLEQKEFKSAKPGSDIQLTLDLNLQKIAETLFEFDQSGVFILMDPHDGSVKVLLSHPNFDPNLFLDPITDDDWNEKFLYNSSLLNRATNALYPPASIFKLITFAAGLEEGEINENTEFDCRGYIVFKGRKYKCQRHWGHGKIDLKTSLAYSCNIPCFEIAQKLKINQLAYYAYCFGLGRKTNFLLNEKTGLVPTYEWKVATKGERWWKGDTLSASIGQTYLLVTPLQIAKMISSICTGYLVKPRILSDEDIERDELLISDYTLNILRDSMTKAVDEGTAKMFRKLKDFKIHAKTGTAQTTSLKSEVVKKSQLEHAWFASYFKYKNHEPLTLIVLVENAGSSKPAQKIALNFLKNYQALFN
ncbi:MAG: penicillin-binding protein 2 [bacterium]